MGNNLPVYTVRCKLWKLWRRTPFCTSEHLGVYWFQLWRIRWDSGSPCDQMWTIIEQTGYWLIYQICKCFTVTDENMPCHRLSAFWLRSGEELDMSGYQYLELQLSKCEKYLDNLWGHHCMPGRTGTHNNEGLGPAVVLSGWLAIVMSLKLIMCGYFLNIVLNPNETEAAIYKYRSILWRYCVSFPLSCCQERIGFHI